MRIYDSRFIDRRECGGRSLFRSAALLLHGFWQIRMIDAMTTGFTPIRFDDYVEQHLHANPEVERVDLVERLRNAVAAAKRGERCQCGRPIWIIGSAEMGLSCFTCITGESRPDKDYEIDITEFGKAAEPLLNPRSQ